MLNYRLSIISSTHVEDWGDIPGGPGKSSTRLLQDDADVPFLQNGHIGGARHTETVIIPIRWHCSIMNYIQFSIHKSISLRAMTLE